MKHKFISSFILCLVFALSAVRPASAAYIDPNTGGMLFQVLAVLFGVISAMLLLFSSKIKMAFYQLKRRLRESGSKNGGEVDPDE